MTSVPTAAIDPLESAVSKVKRHILPLFLIMFIANYIDRVNIGFVNSHMQPQSHHAFHFWSFLINFGLFPS